MFIFYFISVNKIDQFNFGNSSSLGALLEKVSGNWGVVGLQSNYERDDFIFRHL